MADFSYPNSSSEAKKRWKKFAAAAEERIGPSLDWDVSGTKRETHLFKYKYLRLYSDFDNFRKRSIKEKNDAYKNATSDVFKSFLPTLDDFDRALKSVETATDIDSLREGINLIHAKLVSTLKQKGLAEMEAQSKDFDADYHEAITEIPAPTEELKGKVVDVVEKGYMLDAKIIRYAKVIVGK